jgi:hypothetical protein
VIRVVTGHRKGKITGDDGGRVVEICWEVGSEGKEVE